MKTKFLNLLKYSLFGIDLLLLFIGFSLICNQYIIDSTSESIYSEIVDVPEQDVALVLGASKYLGSTKKYINLYFKYRMETAAALYHAGKVKHILVSGDNHAKDYDEPTDMRNYLIGLGVDSNDITRDYAGFRTYDSVIRAKLIFGLDRFIIVSQKFHNQRALFICKQLDIDAVAINAKDVYMGPESLAREYLAKTKAVIDFIIGTQPRFLGCKEYICLKNNQDE